MITKALKIVQLTAEGDYVYAIDNDGDVWFRHKLPGVPYSTMTQTDRRKRAVEEEEEARAPWRPLSGMGRIANDDMPTDKTNIPEIEGRAVDAKPIDVSPMSRSSIPTEYMGNEAYIHPAMRHDIEIFGREDE